jgi:hypothetical protein
VVVGSPRFCFSPTVFGLHPDTPSDVVIPADIAALSEAISEGYWEGKRVVFDAPKRADREVELAREKATK